MFWHFPESFSRQVALIYDDTQITYAELQQRIEQTKEQLPDSGGLVFLFCKNDLHTILVYLACLQKRVPVMLLDAQLSNEQVEYLVSVYSPSTLVRDGNFTFTQLSQATIDKRLAILLSTSGSTGTAKQVALSYENLQANAESICRYLPILATDVTITTLPSHYSYGLSVINTHLLRGAGILLSDASVLSKEFWHCLKAHSISSFAGVPYTYEMLTKLRFQQKVLPQLRYLTQAGGRLNASLLTLFADWMTEQNKAFYVMYGQTEATARMAWLPPEKLARKPGSIGNAIPGGRLYMINEKGQSIDSGEGELVYEGPNVMLGYASNRVELAQFTPQSTLRTGDLASRDEDGDYWIVGRLKRFIKIFGLRIGLDEVEKQLEQAGIEARVCGEDEQLLVAILAPADCDEVKAMVSKRLKLHPSTIRVIQLDSFPTNTNKKTDYQALKLRFAGSHNNE